MKNFILAFVVFLIWGAVSIFYLHESGSFQKYLGETTNPNNRNIDEGKAVFSVIDDPYFTPEPSVYPDNSLLSNEMKNTVDSMKEQQGIEQIKKNIVSKDPEDAQVLFPNFKYGKLIISQDLINYGKDLEHLISVHPKTKITFIGHFTDEDTSLDNYFEGLKRAKQLKRYIIQNFSVPESYLSAISEGESRPFTDPNSNVNPTKNNRIEILIED
ncbi:MAG TPA: hypothetical protein ENH91_06480 [Leeuwenhoekiella sp.]|nr:hypothetical protein [Leeuwenhoekiella sp.]